MRYSLTQDRLKEILHYDPDTGTFTWITRPSYRADIGDIAGSINPDGYVLTQIKGIKYFNHILAHLYMTGSWPEGETDHINKVRDDNRWCNLRDISREENQSNRVWPVGASGVRGITAHKSGKWQVALNRKYLGIFNTLEEAKKFLGGLQN